MTEPASLLAGKTLDDGWYVDSILTRKPSATGGNFSVGYLVSKEGRKGFLKAFSLLPALNSADPIGEVQRVTSLYAYERDLLKRCAHLDRISTTLSHGHYSPMGGGGQDRVYYLIFPLADGDVRSVLASAQKVELYWKVRSLHHAATGIKQLHGANVAHLDLKPSNVLVFNEDTSKVGDLGRSVDLAGPSPFAQFQVAGDMGYAPLELRYGVALTDKQRRQGVDMYLLGSLILYYFANITATGAICAYIGRNHQGDMRGDFLIDLPYIQNAFAAALADLRSGLQGHPTRFIEDLVAIVAELCEPDFRLRGNRTSLGSPQYDLQTYVTRLDLMARRLEFSQYAR